MSKRSHHRHNGININELAEALTRQGWQPPRQEPMMQPMMPPLNPQNGGGPFPPDIQALSGLLGGMNHRPMMQNRPPCPTPQNDKELLKALFQQILTELRCH